MARGLPPNPPPNAAKRGTPSGVPPGECKPALESCSVNSECCADLCLLGVSVPLSEFMNVSVLRCSDYSFAFNWHAEIVCVCVPYREFHCSCCSQSPLLSPWAEGQKRWTDDVYL
ncbi:hypothetical protein K438DRAFT_1858152 [Mycena galopus ATCC 62051]|nr:hypothetical protein K438DRAFT_1858152 [Mycena galopus ATCC 62051]